MYKFTFSTAAAHGCTVTMTPVCPVHGYKYSMADMSFSRHWHMPADPYVTMVAASMCDVCHPMMTALRTDATNMPCRKCTSGLLSALDAASAPAVTGASS